MIPQPHDIIKRGPGHFECRVCFKTWQNKSQSPCPGVRAYEQYDYAPLMTRKELAYLGYRATIAALPPAVGCYYKHGAGAYVYLYDPIHAIPKKPNRGIPNAITEILWPLCGLSVLATLSDMQPLRTLSPLEREQAQQLFTEISNIAALTGIYTRAELEQIIGGVIVFTLPPTILYRFYPAQRANIEEERKMQANLLIAYRKYITLSHPVS